MYYIRPAHIHSLTWEGREDTPSSKAIQGCKIHTHEKSSGIHEELCVGYSLWARNDKGILAIKLN